MSGLDTVIRHLEPCCRLTYRHEGSTGVCIQSHAILLALLSMTSSLLWPTPSHTVVNILAALTASNYHEKHSASMIRFVLKILNFAF